MNLADCCTNEFWICTNCKKYSIQSVQTVWKNVNVYYQRLLTLLFFPQWTRLLTFIIIILYVFNTSVYTRPMVDRWSRPFAAAVTASTSYKHSSKWDCAWDGYMTALPWTGKNHTVTSFQRNIIPVWLHEICKLILRKIINTVATRFHRPIIKLKHEIRFRLGLRLNPRWGSLQRSQTP